MGRKLQYTEESVARALEIHRYHGRIRNVYGPMDRLSVELNNGETVQLRSLREAYVLVLGIASTVNAPQEEVAK